LATERLRQSRLACQATVRGEADQDVLLAELGLGEVRRVLRTRLRSRRQRGDTRLTEVALSGRQVGEAVALNGVAVRQTVALNRLAVREADLVRAVLVAIRNALAAGLVLRCKVIHFRDISELVARCL